MGEVLANCRKLVSGDPDYTFGLSGWETATRAEVVAAVAEVCGCDPTRGEPRSAGFIDPAATVAAIRRHQEHLRGLVRAGGGSVLLATGHPTGLLPHYAALARALDASGCRVLTPLDDTLFGQRDGRPLGVRFLDGVACVWGGADLLHTHRAGAMVAMLEQAHQAGTGPDLVIGDHGMAGAAIEAGIPTLSIADVNDPALLLAQAHGRTSHVMPIDDNLTPRVFRPVSAAVLAGLGGS